MGSFAASTTSFLIESSLNDMWSNFTKVINAFLEYFNDDADHDHDDCDDTYNSDDSDDNDNDS